KDDLLIEGRVISNEQDQALQEHPLFGIFDTRRWARKLMEQQLVRHLQREGATNIELNDIFFTPRSIRDDIGHTLGWFNAGDMVKEWLSSGTPNHMLPAWRGVSAFNIGSNNLTQDQLKEAKRKIVEVFKEEDKK